MKYQSCLTFQNILLGIRPAVLALILYAGYILAELAITDIKTGVIALASFAVVHRWHKLHPVIFILGGAAAGVSAVKKASSVIRLIGNWAGKKFLKIAITIFRVIFNIEVIREERRIKRRI